MAIEMLMTCHRTQAHRPVTQVDTDGNEEVVLQQHDVFLVAAGDEQSVEFNRKWAHGPASAQLEFTSMDPRLNIEPGDLYRVTISRYVPDRGKWAQPQTTPADDQDTFVSE